MTLHVSQYVNKSKLSLMDHAKLCKMGTSVTAVQQDFRVTISRPGATVATHTSTEL